MNQNKTPPRLSDQGKSEADLRRQRQAEALRANLARRKTQSRGRAETQDETADETAAPAGDAPATADRG